MSQASEKESVVLAALEAERQRRIDEKVEAGTAIRVPITVVTAAADDADDALVSARADKIAALRRAGERREVVLEPLQIFTGVPRPDRDAKYSARLEREHAALTVEQRQQKEAETAAQVESFHEGSKSHEPEPRAPLPRSVVAAPPSDLHWGAIVVPISGPSPTNPAGTCAEGKFGVADFVLYVADAEGSLLTSRLLHPDDDPRAIARAALRERSKPNPFYGDLPYKKPGTW